MFPQKLQLIFINCLLQPMGNSNQIQQSPVRLQASSRRGGQSREGDRVEGVRSQEVIHPFYGLYRCRPGESILKQYLIDSLEKQQQFQTLVRMYRNISYPSVIQIVSIKQEVCYSRSKRYQIQFPFYPFTLASSLDQGHSYTEEQIVDLLVQLSEALNIFQQHQFPIGIVNSHSVAIPNNNQRHFVISHDILMHPERYHSDHRSISHQASNNTIIQNADQLSSAVQSLGQIVLTIVQGNRKDQKGRERLLFQLRQHHSYEFVSIVAQMLADSISLGQLVGSLKQLQELHRNNSLQERATFRRGYNCLQFPSFFHPPDPSPRTKRKLQSFKHN